MAARGDITIGWVKLAALEGCQSRNDNGLWPPGFPDLLPGIRWNEHHNGCVASLSSIFSRGLGRKKEVQSAIIPPASSLPIVPFTPARGTYAYEVLQRKFKEFDADNQGYISEGDFKVALKGLNLPDSEEGVQDFLAKLDDSTRARPVTFENFVEYAIQQENQLANTFKELDKRKTGFISLADMKTALQTYKFRLTDKALKRMVSRFNVRKGKSESVIDYADYRDILMVSTINDLRDPYRIWERAYTDLGDVDTSFPLSSGTFRSTGPREAERQKQVVQRHLLAGAISAAISRTSVASLERLKLLSMVNPDFTKDGLFHTWARLWRDEGFGGLFRGNLPNLLGIAPTKVVEYVVYKGLEDCLNKNKRGDMPDKERRLLGSIAAMSGTFISHPIDTVRTALTVQVNGTQNRMMETAQAILHSRGLFGLYKGIIPNMMRVAPYAAINFVVYDELMQYYRRRNGPGGELGLSLSVCCGVLAGAAAQIVVYPLETVQRRLQAHAAQQSLVVYQNMFDAFRLIIQDEGVAALYAGLLPNTLKLVPAAAVSILVYEALQKKLDPKQHAVK